MRTTKSRLAAMAGGLALAIGMVAHPVASAATLLSDDFEDGTADGWTRSGGSWSVVTDGSRAYQQSGTSTDARALVGGAWSDQSVRVRVKPSGFNGSGRQVAALARAQNTSSYYYLALSNAGALVLGKRSGGAFTTLSSAPAAVSTGTWQTVRLEAFGSTLRGFVGDVQMVTATDGTFTSGRAGVATYYAAASFDDVTVTDVPGDSEQPPPTDPPPSGTCDTSGRPTGFASVTAWGQSGTTGGAGGATVEVDTAAEFVAAAGQSGPLNICVRGMITLPGPMHDVASDKTIIGIGSSSGFTGGGLNIGLPVSDVTTPPANAVHNVIVRNLVFHDWPDDALNVQMFSHHVWLDHNDLSGGYDGAIDIKRGSSYVTVSWNHTHHHTKNMLLGHDDGNAAQDVGRLKVSYHHNWFDQTPQRNPRVRFGEPVHVYNNYYLHNTDVGIACQANAGCLVEGNYFDNVEEPVSNHYAGPAGRCVARNNVFTGAEPGQPECGGTVEEPSDYYNYTLDDPADVRTIVMAGAGVGKI
jgi:pectate lyase